MVFVESHLDTVTSAYEELEADIDCYNKVFVNIWKITARTFEMSSNWFAELIVPPTDDHTAVRSTLLLLFVTAFLRARFKRTAQESLLIKARVSVTSSVLTAIEGSPPNDGPQGHLFERAILRFAEVMRGFLESGTLPTERFFTLLSSTRSAVFNFLMKRLIGNLTFFSSSPAFLYETLVILRRFSESLRLVPLVKANEFLQSFSNRQIVFNFEGLDPASLRKLLPALHHIYTRNLIAKTQDMASDDWRSFLSFFDDGFTNVADPASAFNLFRELKGVFAALNTGTVSSSLLSWLLSNHLERILAAIRAHAADAAILGAIAQLWAVVAARKKDDFPPTSALGIELFRGSTAIVQAIAAAADVEDSPWFMVKILLPSFEGRYANFGIMRLYEDHSFESMHAAFFALLERWAPGQTGKRLTWTIAALSALQAIDASLVLAHEPHFAAATALLLEALLANSREIWIAACGCAAALLEAGAPIDIAGRFDRHLVVIIDVFVNRPIDNESRKPAARVVFLMRKHAPEAVESIIGDVIANFEEKYRPAVQKIAQPAFGNPLPAESCTSDYQCAIEAFAADMQRYPMHLATIDRFAPIFRRA
jgi:hypothetical protein